MTIPTRATRSPLAAAGLVAAAAIASLTPAPAAADSYDIDCKLILCLPAGFPSGCRDAYRHMVDRLRDGKSPIGFCSLSDGTEYDAYDIDYAVIPAHLPEGWQCPTGKRLYHSVRFEDEGTRYRVNTFCYSASYSYGYETRMRYTNKTPPERVDFKAKLTVEPGTPASYSAGWQRFDTDMASDWSTEVRYAE